MLFFKYSIKCHNFISLHIYYFFTCIKNYNLYDNFYSLNYHEIRLNKEHIRTCSYFIYTKSISVKMLSLNIKYNYIHFYTFSL